LPITALNLLGAGAGAGAGSGAGFCTTGLSLLLELPQPTSTSILNSVRQLILDTKRIGGPAWVLLKSVFLRVIVLIGIAPEDIGKSLNIES